jgi:hypothetical protein
MSRLMREPIDARRATGPLASNVSCGSDSGHSGMSAQCSGLPESGHGCAFYEYRSPPWAARAERPIWLGHHPCGLVGGSLYVSSGHLLSTTARISSEMWSICSISSVYLWRRFAQHRSSIDSRAESRTAFSACAALSHSGQSAVCANYASAEGKHRES